MDRERAWAVAEEQQETKLRGRLQEAMQVWQQPPPLGGRLPVGGRLLLGGRRLLGSRCRPRGGRGGAIEACAYPETCTAGAGPGRRRRGEGVKGFSGISSD